MPIGDVLAAVAIDGKASQGAGELGAFGGALDYARDLLLDPHLAADRVYLVRDRVGARARVRLGVRVRVRVGVRVRVRVRAGVRVRMKIRVRR